MVGLLALQEYAAKKSDPTEKATFFGKINLKIPNGIIRT